MGFKGFCLLLVAGFVAGCGSTSGPEQGAYSGSNPNQGQLGQPGQPGQATPAGQATLPPMQSNNGNGTAIAPTVDIDNNPILNPSGVTGAPVGPNQAAVDNVVPVPPVNNQNLVAAPPPAQPPVAVAQPQVNIEVELRGLSCPRTNVVYYQQNAAAQAAWMQQNNIQFAQFQMTLRYFQMTTVFINGRDFWAFDGLRAAKLTNMIFAQRPNFDIYQFNVIYREIVARGCIGYIAIDKALARMGIRIATCRI